MPGIFFLPLLNGERGEKNVSSGRQKTKRLGMRRKKISAGGGSCADRRRYFWSPVELCPSVAREAYGRSMIPKRWPVLKASVRNPGSAWVMHKEILKYGKALPNPAHLAPYGRGGYLAASLPKMLTACIRRQEVKESLSFTETCGGLSVWNAAPCILPAVELPYCLFMPGL